MSANEEKTMIKFLRGFLAGLLIFPATFFPGAPLQRAHATDQTYDTVQHMSVKKSTAAISNDWYYRGNFHFAADTTTVRVDQAAQYTHLYATGTIAGLLFEGTRFVGTTFEGLS